MPETIQKEIDLVIDCAKALGFPKSAKDLRETGKCEVGGRRFSFALSPDMAAHGSIETLILGEIESSPLFKCVAQSFDCIELENSAAMTAKAKVQMYISAVANSGMAGVVHAFAAGMFNPQHASYAGARSMIDYALK